MSAARSKPLVSLPSATLDPLHLSELDRMAARLARLRSDLVAYIGEQRQAAKERGVLGSRGLTQFVIELLRAMAIEDRRLPGGAYDGSSPGLTLRQIIEKAEQAGYAVVSATTLGDRLSERAYRTGDIAWRRTGKSRKRLDNGVWYWTGSKQQADE